VPRIILGPVLRHVDDRSATIWLETDGPCEIAVLDARTRTFCVGNHHYGLVVVDALEPGSINRYEVALDGERQWPLDGSTFPASVIRTTGGGGPVRVLFGSCRAAAPHVPPYSLELDHDDRGCGVDALRAHGLRMLRQPIDAWPDLVVFLGDQVYADDTSPMTDKRIAQRRPKQHDSPPRDVVADFEEYTWLYHESWTPDVERWLLSVVPSTMIFDDHDMIDDWNISDRWVREMRSEPWWPEHIIGGLVSYWIYQHLGNLSPAAIVEEGMLAELLATEDGTEYMRRWALSSEEFTPVPGGYQFSYMRQIEDVRLVVVDARNGRVLDPGGRRMLDEKEWAWIVEQSSQPCQHLLLASSLPVLVPGGLHGLQQWNEAVCDGAWGRLPARLGERIRRSIDLEDWAAFDISFQLFTDLLTQLATRAEGHEPPQTINLLSGDIHFAYVATVEFADDAGAVSRVRQLVCSPLRNALVTRERRVIRWALSTTGRRVGRWLMRSVRRPPSSISWELDHDAVFANNIGMLTFDGAAGRLVVERAQPDDNGQPMLEVLIDEAL
jgi:hypothetical protein